MASFNRISSPVVVLPPQNILAQPYTMNNNGTISNHDTAANGFDFPSATSPLSRPSPAAATPNQWNQPSAPTPLSAAGRKRSRDEAGDSLMGSEDGYFPAPVPTKEPDDNWVYGEGMTLIRPNGYVADASSQTGTWVEEKAAEEERVLQAQLADRPVLRSNKSQRLDMTATPAIPEEINLGNGIIAASSPPKTIAEPTVDDFTLHLGIGWSRMSEDEDKQAAARGWARFIENHYPIHDVNLRLQSKGLASYLVEAQEGYFLFSEDLKQGRLVSVTLEKTFDNLKQRPPVFDSNHIMTASGTMTPAADNSSQLGTLLGQSVPFELPPNDRIEVEMDMS